ncbi:MAG: ureidoglycolate lyase [Armatimonadetes bacterium]|nr:ureidoglycolate lyase [Armatimonadota bacterium]MDW8027356.1 ureidoglycolate lyase [Armatimonadota bacterium]
MAVRKFVLRCQPLAEENFAPFGYIVRNFAEAKPNLIVGEVVRNRMRARQVREIELVSAHYDGEQIVFPCEPVPTVFIVAPPSERPSLESFRAFLSDGTLGICLAIGVWHALPIPIDRDHALYENAQGSQWHEHTVEFHLTSELDAILCVEW